MSNGIKEEWVAEITEVDSEIWRGDIEGNSREDVIEDGMREAKEEGLKSFRIGRKIPVCIPAVDAELVINDACEQIYDEVGECGDTFMENVTDKQEEELEEQLSEVFYNWVKKHHLEPTCYTVVDEETINVE